MGAQDRIDKMRRGVAGCLLILIVLSLNVGCSSWSPSDDEAVRLVKDYYLYFYNSEVVDAKIVSRWDYIEENKCYPIEFMIIPTDKEGFKKVFYFYKNDKGEVAVREFQFGQKYSAL
jgi:hypothetical protein